VTVTAPVIEVATAAMGTVFAVQCSGDDTTALRRRAGDALEIVAQLEATCSRFREESELARLSATCGTAVAVSPLLFELLGLALAVADVSDGAFDPTVGRPLSRMGFMHEWAHGTPRELPAPAPASWRDVLLDHERREVTLRAPLHLDLGGIAKGFAVDLVAQALADVPLLSIHAGGDVFCRGAHPDGRDWRVGITHPVHPERLIATAALAQGAVCTSGSYVRRTAAGHHLIDPRSGHAVQGLRSVSVAAPTTAIADALATAAFVMGPDIGVRWTAEQGADALFVTETLDVVTTPSSHVATWTLL
jgi:thiamine biosynthesis lipoprotein